MTLHDLRRKYPEKICICCAHLRDAGSGRVVSWQCLEAVDTVDAARGILERLDREGVTDAVAISTTERLVIDESLAARYLRVYFGME